MHVLVKLDSSSLTTSVYYKRTGISCLHSNSFHTHSLKNSLVYNQDLIRRKRICSDPRDYEHQVFNLTGNFLNVGYPIHLIKQDIIYGWQLNSEGFFKFKS